MSRIRWLLVVALSFACCSGFAEVIFERTSVYHHIRVVDQAGMRTLCFDDATESRMSVEDPLKGHFEYTEYFHLPWLWNTQISNVLMVGLGGASTQRSFEAYYPGVTVETVEIDQAVVDIARDFFNYRESGRQKIHVSDGRMYLRRSTAKYDLIILDAYVQGRYGAGIPQHLATKEFFQIVRDHLTTNGIVAYNVIGSVNGWRAEIVGAIYRTLNTVFPQVYLFPCKSSLNIVLIATKAKGRAEINGLRQRAAQLIQAQKIMLPTFRERLEKLQAAAPASAWSAPVLTDDYAPVEGLVGGGGVAAPPPGEETKGSPK